MKTITLILFLAMLAPTVDARTIWVGPGQSLRSAFERAADGDTIRLRKGIYREGPLVLTRSVKLIGEEGAVLDGENRHEILLLSGRNILVRGIEFRNSGYSSMKDFASIKLVDATNVIIDRNLVRNAYFAIHISNASRVTVSNNRIVGKPRSEQLTGNGIHLWKSDRVLIAGNHIEGHRDGIYFEFVTNSVIRNNHSEKNTRYGLHFMFSNNDRYEQNVFRDNGAGVAVMFSKKVSMKANRFEQNWGPSAYGILLKEIADSEIEGNDFFRNTVAVHMEGTSRVRIEANDFRENGWAMRVQASCESNEIRKNNFTGNSFDVGTNGSISLNRFELNYWDKYEGYDLDRDGLGDVPYHPVSMYSLIVERNPNALLLLRSFTVSLLDKAERAIPSLTPVELTDEKPSMKKLKR